VSPIAGIVASLEPMPGRGDALRPVFAGTYRVCPVGSSPTPNDFHRYSAGKGRGSTQAQASALCEALERQSAAFQGDEPRISARRVDLGDDAVHPDRLQEFSAAQRASAGAMSEESQTGDPRRLVPPPFDEQASIEWTPAWSLTRARRRWLPLTYCYSQVPVRGPLWCPFNPNGHAAGNCLEEAVLQVTADVLAFWFRVGLDRDRLIACAARRLAQDDGDAPYGAEQRAAHWVCAPKEHRKPDANPGHVRLEWNAMSCAVEPRQGRQSAGEVERLPPDR
jgi:ribosomal protein S12 methylthiotransferase accessory factor